MAKVLLEILGDVKSPFEAHVAATESFRESESQAMRALSLMGAAGIKLDSDIAPVPMFLGHTDTRRKGLKRLAEIRTLAVEPDRASRPGTSLVVAAEVEPGRLKELKAHPNVVVWANSDLTLLSKSTPASGAASAAPRVDCQPFREAVSIQEIQRVLGVNAAWSDGFRGKDIVVGIIDEGVNGQTYPVIGGFSRPQSTLQPGSAAVTSHGSMCAADILIAAPDTRLFDYPFLGVPNSGGALQMFQAVLNSRVANGTPHITNNSYGFVGVPDREENPNHEVHDMNHPVHRKVREVVAAGVACFFAAGNCGKQCPSGNCDGSGIGPGRSIHASNSLAEVITIAAVNSIRERIGYSSQGPGMFERKKPDLASFSHMFGNFGPGRPGQTPPGFDNGTSAATPVAAGVAALLLSAFANLDPATLKDFLIRSVKHNQPAGWNADFGHGVIDAGAAYNLLKSRRDAIG
jgi:serine protease AprX